MDSLQAITEYVTQRASKMALFGGRLKFIFPEGALLIDGTEERNVISNEDLPADCTLRMSIQTFNNIHDGKTDAIMAFMLGKIKLSGDSKLALKIKGLM